jgi:hydrogenase nickel incorporation protein HypB
MCTTCGCGTGAARIDGQQPAVLSDPASRQSPAKDRRYSYRVPQTRPHEDGTQHSHRHAGETVQAHADLLDFGAGTAGAHAPGLTQTQMVRIEQDILGKNNGFAAQNRQYFGAHGIFALNLLSSPGSGKTTLLTRTIAAMQPRISIAVIEGDQQTSRDAERIRASGAKAVQINTGKGCHLDAHMIGLALEHLKPQDDSVLMIENVGNLVCPAAFDLGEEHKVVILSVTEGEDKPLKYPDMFHAARLILLNKVDLLPYLNFDLEQCLENVRRVNPGIETINISAVSGEGLDQWLRWIERGLASALAKKNVAALNEQATQFAAPLAVDRG